MGSEPHAPATPATMAGDLAAALDPFNRVGTVYLIHRYAERPPGVGLEQPFPWCDIWCIGGTPEDKAAVLLAMRERPDLAVPPPWWPPRGLEAARARAAQPPAAADPAPGERHSVYGAPVGPGSRRSPTPTSQLTD